MSVHKSMLGKEIDMTALSIQNEMVMAVGNQRVNGRGDELGRGGQVVRKREDIIRHENSKVVTQDK